ncbi:hypothetical protein tb265_05570 [Gemmatimonadetes bacterium T265]|nr:hypothetical protein tb265_05570 [Gemmatimonadetes bacterium T265]
MVRSVSCSGAALSYSRPIFDPFDDPEGDAGASPADREPDDDAADGEDVLLDAAFPLGDGVADVEATVWCPYCGEPTEVAIDPGGGEAQEYVEDCAVCCRPWRVTVAYGADGTARVSAETADE